MKVSVSYLSNKEGFVKTIEKINKSSAQYIHADIMDGKYVENNTFDKLKIKYLSINSKKCDVHLMVEKPSKYLKYFKNEIFEIIYFHPNTEKDVSKMIKKIHKKNKLCGLVINPDEKIKMFVDYLPFIDYVLFMSVKPGEGGQKFLKTTIKKIDDLNKIIKKNNYEIKIAVDGGIDDVSGKLLKNKNIEYVVSGSYICSSEDFEKQIKKL